jgi:hypothetical protein
MTAMARSLSEQAPTASSERPTAGYVFSTDWVSFHVDLWRRTFGHLAGRPGMAILEVGCFEGRATVWMLKTLLTDPSARITCVDTFAGSFEHPLMGLDLGGGWLGDGLQDFGITKRPKTGIAKTRDRPPRLDQQKSLRPAS